jgi:hypothetical protein
VATIKILIGGNLLALVIVIGGKASLAAAFILNNPCFAKTLKRSE